MAALLRICLILFGISSLSGIAHAKWVEGRINTKENWAFLERFCFLSLDGQFEYLIEFDRDMGVPNLLLYYDDESQWPAVYHSGKSCKEREAILNKAGQNQIIKLSHWYPDTEYSGCIVTKENKELPASKSTTTTQRPTTTNTQTTKTKNTTTLPPEPSFYDQFLKTTAKPKSTITDANSTIWYELPADDFNITTTMLPEDELWESVGENRNGSRLEKLRDVELMFDSRKSSVRKIKRSTFELYERFRRRRLKAESDQNELSGSREVERLIVSCHNSRRFRSARERWWFIAISNCDSNKGLDIRYRFLMTNGPDGDFWHEHFSADEFYVLPILLSYTLAYVIVMIAVVMCSVELKSRHLLHSTYKLFLISILAQHSGVLIQSLGYIRYASSGIEQPGPVTVGQFFCGMSEMTFLLLLLLMAKGYTITRGRLEVGFTVRLTVFMCCYTVTYIILFVYQAKAFDPGEVLYLYESPAGYGLIVLRIAAWCVFAYSIFFTVKKYPEKNMFYCPFSICGTLWFYAGPLFILTANNYIDKWVRVSVVTAVLLFITFCGHIMFLLLTLPVFANKNFPYHVRTTQIGIMEVTGSNDIDSFGRNAYHPSNGVPQTVIIPLTSKNFLYHVRTTQIGIMEVTGSNDIDSFGRNAYHPSNGVPQTVIIPLTRRTEELIGNMYNQYMATAPPLSTEQTPKLNGISKTLLQQDSTETNTSDDIKPYVNEDKVFTVESQMAKIENERIAKNEVSDSSLNTESLPMESMDSNSSDLPSVLRSRRILEPIKRDVPSWSLAKGPTVISMQKKKDSEDSPPSSLTNGLPTLPPLNGRKVPPVRNGLPSSGEISTIREGQVQSYNGNVSKATVDLFTANRKG